jgi:hypothetical protein
MHAFPRRTHHHNHHHRLPREQGRDIGMLQITVFESKVSATRPAAPSAPPPSLGPTRRDCVCVQVATGSTVSMTSRDACRVTHAVEAFRMLSLWHTWAGFYVSCATIAAATLLYAHFLALMAAGGVDGAAVGTSAPPAFLGPVAISQWVTQLGGLYVLPLLVALAVERGWLKALGAAGHLVLCLGPLFYVAHMHTRAIAFDLGLSFGRSAYAATGRDFVIRHVSFPETYRAVGHTHMHFGAELLLLLLIIWALGSFTSFGTYFFMLSGTIVYCVSLLLAFLWFNPYALDAAAIVGDVKATAAWLWGPTTGPGASDAAASHAGWLDATVMSLYATAPVRTRVFHALRQVRWLALAFALTFREPLTQASSTTWVSEGIYIAVLVVIPLAAMAWLEGMGRACSPAAPPPGAPAAGPTASGTGRQVVHTALQSVALLLLVAASVLTALLVPSDTYSGGRGGGIVATLVSLLLMTWALAQLAIVLWAPCALRAARAVVWAADAAIACVLLPLQLVCAVLVPFGSTLHAYLLFPPRYAGMLETLVGARLAPREAARE